MLREALVFLFVVVVFLGGGEIFFVNHGLHHAHIVQTELCTNQDVMSLTCSPL